MKTILLSTALLIALGAHGERVETRYEEGQTLRITSKGSSEMVLEEVSVTLNDEELPNDAMPVGEGRTEESSMEYVDRVVEAEDGARRVVQRTFETITRKTESDGEVTTKTGVLEGRAIRIEADGDGAVTTSVADEEGDVDELYLQGFELRYDEELLLPRGEVSEGDSWSVDGDEARRFLGFVGGTTWFEEDDSEEDGPDFEALFEDSIEVSLEVTHAGSEEVDGEACWLLTYELEFHAEVDDVDPADVGMGGDGEESPFGPDATAGVALHGSGEGRFLVSKADRRPVASNGSGSAGFEIALEADMAGMEFVLAMEIAVELAGETSWAIEE